MMSSLNVVESFKKHQGEIARSDKRIVSTNIEKAKDKAQLVKEKNLEENVRTELGKCEAEESKQKLLLLTTTDKFSSEKQARDNAFFELVQQEKSTVQKNVEIDTNRRALTSSLVESCREYRARRKSLVEMALETHNRREARADAEAVDTGTERETEY